MQVWRRLGFGECTRKSVQPHADTMTAVVAVPLKQLLPAKQSLVLETLHFSLLWVLLSGA